jgi:hypothetical protein
MFSVILPTLWKINFNQELEKLNSSSSVGEIILINNDKNNTPEWFKETNYDKLREIKPFSNVFVNPAWNMGAKLARYENIILHSDDVVSNSYEFLNEVDDTLRKDDCIIGIDKSCFNNPYEIGKIEYNDISNVDRDLGFGCMMFLRTSSYKSIPTEYLIWRGDDFLIDLFKHKSKKVLTIQNINMVNSKIAVSSDLPEFNWKEQKEGPKDKYLRYLEEYLK